MVGAFEFVSEQPAVVSVTVSSDVTSRAALAKLFVSSLGFPSWHTGKSWDATYDWMTDFGWLDEGATVVIWHPGLPVLGTRDLRLYLERIGRLGEELGVESSTHLSSCVCRVASFGCVGEIKACLGNPRTHLRQDHLVARGPCRWFRTTRHLNGRS